MPIKNLTGEAAWPRLGILRKGEVKKSEKAPGADLDDKLRFVALDGSVFEDWLEAFGSDQVTELTVRLPYPLVDRCWHAWREHWVKGGLVCRCDGEEHVVWRGNDAKLHGPGVNEDVPAQACPGSKCPAKAVGRLEVVVPDLPRMGVVTVMTTSIHDIQNIDGCLRALALSFGDLSRIPLRLTRVPRDISTPAKDEDGKPIRVRRTKWLLALEAAPRWVRYMLDAGGQAPAALLIEGTFSELPAPTNGIYDEETGELLPAPSDDPSDVPAPSDDHGEPENEGELIEGTATTAVVKRPSSFSEAIQACESIEDLRALWTPIAEIAAAKRKANVAALWYRRAAKLLERDIWSATTADQLVDVRAKLTALPAGTEGRDEALDLITTRMRELVPEHAMA